MLKYVTLDVHTYNQECINTLLIQRKDLPHLHIIVTSIYPLQYMCKYRVCLVYMYVTEYAWTYMYTLCMLLCTYMYVYMYTVRTRLSITIYAHVYMYVYNYVQPYVIIASIVTF